MANDAEVKISFVEIRTYKCRKCGRIVQLEGDEKPIKCPSLICPNHRDVSNTETMLPWQKRKAEEEAALAKKCGVIADLSGVKIPSVIDLDPDKPPIAAAHIKSQRVYVKKKSKKQPL